MYRQLAFCLMCLGCFFLFEIPYPLDAQEKDKKIKNIYYGKVIEVSNDKVVVIFEKDWNNEKLDRKHVFATNRFSVLILKTTKDPKKAETKSNIEDLKGEVVPGKEATKILPSGMKIMCPIYNGGPPETDAIIVITGRKKPA